jgi:hypothetical protein
MHFWGQYKTIQNLLQLELKILDLKKINYIFENDLDYLNFGTRLLNETFLDTPKNIFLSTMAWKRYSTKGCVLSYINPPPLSKFHFCTNNIFFY